ncbi:hypothetical protein FKM82_020216 [Ascaphus truei]
MSEIQVLQNALQYLLDLVPNLPGQVSFLQSEVTMFQVEKAVLQDTVIILKRQMAHVANNYLAVPALTLPMPERVDGNPDKCQVFFNQCEIHFHFCYCLFLDDKAKIGFVLSNLSGCTYVGYTTALSEQHPGW